MSLPTGIRKLMWIQSTRRRRTRKLVTSFNALSPDCIGMILVKLQPDFVVRCKLVSQLWNAIISSPLFAKLYSECAQPTTVLIRTCDDPYVSRKVHFFQYNTEAHWWYHTVRPSRILKLPLCSDRHPPLSDEMVEIPSNPCLDKFQIVNSCDGILCLCGPFIWHPATIVICNPLIGDFIKIPDHAHSRKKFKREDIVIHVGFGFQLKKSNTQDIIKEYKVVKLFAHKKVFERAPFIGNCEVAYERVMIEVNTVGTPIWRMIDGGEEFVEFIGRLDWPTCVSGAIHWLSFDRSILRFHLATEQLDTFPALPNVIGDLSMGELKELLYICDKSIDSVTMWLLKNYGSKEQLWIRAYTIQTIARLPREVFWPILLFEERMVVLSYHGRRPHRIYEYDSQFYPEDHEEEHTGWTRVFNVAGTNSRLLEIIAHIPNIMPMKYAIKGDVAVMNVRSR